MNDDVLKEAKMTPEEYQQFLKAYKNMLDKDRLKHAEKENLPGPSKGGAAQPNRDLRKVETMADPKISAELRRPAAGSYGIPRRPEQIQPGYVGPGGESG